MTDDQFVKELFRDYTGPASMETVRAMKRLLDQRTQERDEAHSDVERLRSSLYALEERVCELQRELDAERGESARQRLVTWMTVENAKATQNELADAMQTIHDQAEIIERLEARP